MNNEITIQSFKMCTCSHVTGLFFGWRRFTVPNPGQDEGSKRERGAGYDLLQSFFFRETTPLLLHFYFLSSRGSLSQDFSFFSSTGFKPRPIDMNTTRKLEHLFTFVFVSHFSFLAELTVLPAIK